MKKPDKQDIERNGAGNFLMDGKVCLSFLTRLPVGRVDQNRQLGDASPAFAIVGLVVGAATGLIYWLCGLLGLSETLAIILGLASGIAITGALHEDGLADFADSFGGWEKQRKLEIMRDSNIGTYGVLALVVAMAIKIAALSDILPTNAGLLVVLFLFTGIAVISRATMALMMYQLPLARQDGQAVSAGKPSHNTTRLGLMISYTAGLTLLFLATGFEGVIVVFIASFLAYYLVRETAKRQLGGYSGDVLGTLQQVTEISCLVALSCIF